MKLQIGNSSYKMLSSYEVSGILAMCLNDFVSTTRKDREGGVHLYENRYSILLAFMKASKNKIVSVVSANNLSPIKAKVISVHPPDTSGLYFTVDLKPVNA